MTCRDQTEAVRPHLCATSADDSFTIAQRDEITAVPVEGWHSSLQNGFTNGPGRFFKGNPAEPDALSQ